MSLKQIASRALRSMRTGLVTLAMFQFAVGSSFAGVVEDNRSTKDADTRTPIKHVIVIIGENRTFDHVFATYIPKRGESVWNLLSQGIINADGTPGPKFKLAEQKAASDAAPDAFLLSPPKTSFPGNVMPAPLVGGAKDSPIPGDSLTLAQQSENGLPSDYYQYLISGGTGLTSRTPDTRITNVNNLPPGPFQLTNSSTLDYNAYAASPVHRFYQMWQQLNCSAKRATKSNPSGCNSKLFPWVETTVGAGANGIAQPSNFSTDYAPGAVTTGEGSTAMGFYNMLQGDAPYFKKLADQYAMSDNFHQSVQGGTGANHIMLGHGDMIFFSDGKGHAAKPPHNQEVASGTPSAGIVDQIENPNPAPGTNNWYTEDGYGGGSFGSPSYGGGSYSDCADLSQPGVAEVVTYLHSLKRPVKANCEKGHYYLLNNYNPGYFGNGNNAYTDTNANNTVFTIPPSEVRSIGDEMSDKKVSWKYYGDQWNNYVPDPYQLNYGAIGTNTDEYCNICNPFQYDTSIMADAKVRNAHMKDTTDLYHDIQNNSLPAVSFVKPSGLVDGHPASSKLNLFEGFTKKIVDAVKSNPEVWKDTAIFITFDEGGGYYDSGFIQPLDYFGDGTRIPMLVVSKYSTGGHIAHDYADHVSILKFIERNWKLQPVTKRSRDNFPNPKAEWDNPYVPVNGPAISDMFELFDFGRGR
ncbi:phosphoesterase [Candidatus Koribacter versatilis Ellin345]|uniref:Phosphoesterase n=1 Tax=Koribacter versatilis (strain Ellin345) TaxID=204669 RepID=Q1IPS2_KORVE|nr:alkaline phosphatase family protein [Candidatus Koribacter versatilis]ABF41128.1 phosphoesterase [Candidatus Koribacter versatilis Ellin345]